MIPLVVIAGPTASGKTALAIEIAKKTGGEIVSADSMQIYKEMDIGTAKPTESEKEGVPHHLIDIASPDENFSLGKFTEKAHSAIKDIYSRGKLPILAGGTGLYTDAVVNNTALADAAGNEEIRKRLAKEAETLGSEALYERLKKTDAESAAKLHINDTKRIIRALEIYEISGITKSEGDRNSKKTKKIYNYLYFAIETEREILYNRINARVDKMIEAGLMEECERLFAKYGFMKTTAMQGIGYRETAAYFRGLATFCETTELIKRNSRRLAKRQMTWLRRNDGVIWVKNTDAEKCIELINREFSL